MSINVDAVRNWPFPTVRQTYSEKATILYALALGYGSQPTDEAQLRFVYEDGLVAVPTMATVLCHPGLWISNPATGVDFKKVVNGEQRMTLHHPLPPAGSLRGETRVTDIIDKGAGKGALVITERRLFDDTSGALIATIEQVTMCRGDGGFSAPAPEGTARPAAAQAGDPQRTPDHVIDIQTLPQAALIYRLSADLNPLHADPAVARAAGFERPILHGLGSYGIAARAIVQSCCDNDPGRLAQLSARFSAPVYPGELIRTEIWMEGDGARYRCLVPQRDVVVISNGSAAFRSA